MCEIRIQQDFITRKERKIEQGYEKKIDSKLMLKRLKVMGNSTSIYTYWALAQISFLKNFQPTCGPCSPMCTHVRTMSELKFNYWSELKFN
jgi:hypothetical protein